MESRYKRTAWQNTAMHPKGGIMDEISLAVGLAVGAILGGALIWLLGRSRTAALNERLLGETADLQDARERLSEKEEALAERSQTIARLESDLEHERKAAQEKIALLDKASEDLKNAFQALSSEALKSNNESFLKLAQATLEKYQAQAKGDLEQRRKAVENLVTPMKETLQKLDSHTHELSVSMGERIKSLVSTQEKLQLETGNLAKALRAPTVRGRWGEIQLKRVVEIAGMIPYCDFVEQFSITHEEKRLRPDLIVKLPGGKNVVVDSKAPLQAYLEALEAQDEEERRIQLKNHARQVREHMRQLSSKAYWGQFDSAPEFVVLFLPGESFFSAALEQDPGLIEQGVGDQVIPATPTTLIALLKAVAYGWQQQQIAENAREISKLGSELYERIRVCISHFIDVRKGLDRAVESYNKSAASLESRVLVSARRFTDLSSRVRGEIEELTPIEKTTREIQAPEAND